MKVEKIIVLGLSPTAKYVGKEAYLFNIKCIAFDFKNGPSKYSRYFENTEIISESELLEKLKRDYLNDGVSYYVCPTSDEWVEFLHKNKILFENTNLKTSLSYLDGSYTLLADKFELMSISNKIGLNYPKSILFISNNTNSPDFSSLDFPIFVKPSNRVGLASVMQGKKGWLFQTKEDWNSFETLKNLEGVELLIQEVIVGPESNIRVLGTVASKGKRVDTWIGIKYRQYPHGFGSGSLIVEDNGDHELDEITDKLLKETQYSGFFALETKFCDKRKKTFIIEVNTRPGLWFGATTNAKLFFVSQWCQSLGFMTITFKGNNHEKVNKPVVWKYFYKDLFISFKKTSKYSSKILIPNQKINSFAVFDKYDLKPFIFDLYNGITKKMGF